jgi:homoprotocatechuate degradation regulator HpaR
MTRKTDKPKSVRKKNPVKPPIRPFANSLPMQLLRVREAVMDRFRPHLHAHVITEQQWRVVRALAEVDSLEIHEVGDRCCVHPASLSHMLPKLESAGIITRKSNAADQRRIVVSLTPAGRRIFLRMAVESERVYAEITRRLGADRIEALYEQLSDALHILSAWDESEETSRSDQAPKKKREDR